MNPCKRQRWNPYLVGIGIGILSWVTFGLMHKALGVSTTLATTPGMVIGIAAPEHVQANAYWAKYFNPKKGKVYFDWQFFHFSS